MTIHSKLPEPRELDIDEIEFIGGGLMTTTPDGPGDSLGGSGTRSSITVGDDVFPDRTVSSGASTIGTFNPSQRDDANDRVPFDPSRDFTITDEFGNPLEEFDNGQIIWLEDTWGPGPGNQPDGIPDIFQPNAPLNTASPFGFF